MTRPSKWYEDEYGQRWSIRDYRNGETEVDRGQLHDYYRDLVYYWQQEAVHQARRAREAEAADNYQDGWNAGHEAGSKVWP